MTRATFGGGAADFVFATGPSCLLRLTEATLTVWDAEVDGDQITDLLLAGDPVETIPVGIDGQIPSFEGPDDVFQVWVDAGGSTRSLLTAGTAVAAEAATAAAAAAEAAKDAAEAVGSTNDTIMTAVANDEDSDFHAQQIAFFVSIDHRPVNLADRLPPGHVTGDPADTILDTALSEGGVVEWPEGLSLTFTDTDGVTIPAGKALRAGRAATALVNHAGDAFKVSGALEGLTIDYTGGSGLADAAVHAVPTSSDVLLRGLRVTGASACYAVGGNEDDGGGDATDVLLEDCHGETAVASSFVFRIDESVAVTMRDCVGTGAALDIIKLRRKARRFRLEGGRFTGAVAGDGLDGFGGAEEAYIGGGAIFHDNAQNGLVFKTDDIEGEDIGDTLAEFGLPQRLVIDGVMAIANEGSGVSLHRSDSTDSDVGGGDLIPWLRSAMVQGVLSAENGKGLFLNLRAADLRGIVAARNAGKGLEVHANARDLTMSGIHALASGYDSGSSTVDNFHLEGKRLRLHQCIAYGVDPDAVADADLSGATPISRYGFRVPTGAGVRFSQCAAYYNATAPISDSDGLSVQIDCEFGTNPSGVVLTNGQVAAIHDGTALRTLVSMSAAGIAKYGDSTLSEMLLQVTAGGFVTSTGLLRPQANNSYGLGSSTRRWADLWLGGALNLLGGPTVRAGTGTPESAVSAFPGSLFIRSDGTAGTLLYHKQTGTGNTGWVAIH